MWLTRTSGSGNGVVNGARSGHNVGAAEYSGDDGTDV